MAYFGQTSKPPIPLVCVSVEESMAGLRHKEDSGGMGRLWDI